MKTYYSDPCIFNLMNKLPLWTIQLLARLSDKEMQSLGKGKASQEVLDKIDTLQYIMKFGEKKNYNALEKAHFQYMNNQIFGD